MGSLLVSLYEFKQFLQIVLWIALPATLLAVLATTILHYRRKKKRGNIEPAYIETGFRTVMSGNTDQLPDWLASSDPDNTSLLKKYEQEIRRYKENYSTLEQDYKEIEGKYSDLLNKAYQYEKQDDGLVNNLEEEIKGYKAQLQDALKKPQEEADKMQRYFSEQLEILGRQHEQEKNELIARLELVKQLQIPAELPAENNTDLGIREKLAEQQYLQDMLQEKKLQTDFLENQLEQRIRSYHHLEHHAAETASQLQHQQEAIRGKISHIESLEFNLQELQQQQAALQSVIDDKQDAIMLMQGTIAHEQQKTRELENKLEMSSQLLVKIYTELAKSFGAGLMHMQTDIAPSILNGSNGHLTWSGEQEHLHGEAVH
jgi:hypothetical protein